MKLDENSPKATNGRGSLVEMAIELDGLIARSEAHGMPFVAYLLRVARDEISERLGERVRRE